MNKKKILLTLLLGITFSQHGEAQIWKKIKNKVKNKIEKKVDKKIDEVLNSKKNTNKNKPTNKNEKKIKQPLDLWTNYDFVVGDNVLFFDDFEFDDYGAFPARWDINFGNAEIVRLNGKKAFLLNGATSVFPLISNLNFSLRTTIEFDIYCGEKFWQQHISSSYLIKLWEKADKYDTYEKSLKNSKLREIEIRKNGNVFEVSMGSYGKKISLKDFDNYIGWHHIAIVLNGNDQLQLYFNEMKMLNLPKLGATPTGLNIQESDFGGDKNTSMAIKAVKIAQGGNSLYKQITTDGSFVTNGILFNVGKVELKPASGGVLKKVMNMLIDNPNWKFEIIGHTDSDGEEKNNFELSQKRAKSVKKALINMGISPSRLTTLGKGESEPLNTNSTPEEKANNRRVVFILK